MYGVLEIGLYKFRATLGPQFLNFMTKNKSQIEIELATLPDTDFYSPIHEGMGPLGFTNPE